MPETSTGTDPAVAALARRCQGRGEPGAPLAAYTTLKVGGAARALVTAESDQDLATVGEVCADHDLPWLVVGRGSNLLLADAGWPGVAIALGRAFRALDLGPASDSDSDGGRTRLFRAGAAEPLPSLAARLAGEGLVGFAWASAVPGSLGGAVRMNAGAHGSQLDDHLVEVELVRLSSGVREIWPASALGLSYRHSELPADAVVVAASLCLTEGDRTEARDEIREIRRWRRLHQPINEPNCGSVFTNPPGDSAGRLVEAVGGKQLVVGGAGVSQRHANFIVTRPGATAADVRALITELQRRVAETFGLRLRPEVVMAGDFDAER